MQNIWLALVTGFTTGGVSCLVVQGGLLTSSMASAEDEPTWLNKFTKIGSFLAAKLIAYIVLGFGLGALGSTLVLTPTFLGWMQIAAGLFMLATAARLLNLHPIFRYFVIQPPKWAYKIMKNEARSESVFAPAVLGLMTVLIPCGVTQAMMALAVASANPFLGAAIMAAFTIGTSPIFFAMGMAAVSLLKKKAFVYVASLAIFIFGLISINTGQVLRGSAHTIQNYWSVLAGETKGSGQVAGVKNGVQEVTVNVSRTGYTASASTLKTGVPVELKLVTNNVQGCVRAFTIPSLNISKILPETGVETLQFTPIKPGRLAFSCNMGMYTGSFDVVN